VKVLFDEGGHRVGEMRRTYTSVLRANPKRLIGQLLGTTDISRCGFGPGQQEQDNRVVRVELERPALIGGSTLEVAGENLDPTSLKIGQTVVGGQSHQHLCRAASTEASRSCVQAQKTREAWLWLKMSGSVAPEATLPADARPTRGG